MQSILKLSLPSVGREVKLQNRYRIKNRKVHVAKRRGEIDDVVVWSSASKLIRYRDGYKKDRTPRRGEHIHSKQLDVADTAANDSSQQHRWTPQSRRSIISVS